MIRRLPQQGESSQARAKIALRTSGAEELNYLPANALEERRLAQEALEHKMTQDREDLKISYHLASQEADEAKSENPLLCQVSVLKKPKKAKTKFQEIQFEDNFLLDLWPTGYKTDVRQGGT